MNKVVEIVSFLLIFIITLSSGIGFAYIYIYIGVLVTNAIKLGILEQTAIIISTVMMSLLVMQKVNRYLMRLKEDISYTRRRR